MKHSMILLTCLIAFSCLCSANILRLKNVDNGEIMGPFTSGEVVTVGTNRFMVMLGTADIAIKSQLENIVFPRVNFRQTDLRDVVSYLRDASVEHDPNKIGVNFLLVPLKAKSTKDGSTVISPRYPKVTMNIRQVALKDVLSLIQSATGYSVRVQHNAVVIRPPQPANK